MEKDVLIIIPAYNEEFSIGGVVAGLNKSGFKNILVVDDGSKDATGPVARKSGAFVVYHVINTGVGGATATGLAFAKERSYPYAITVDADGQHSMKDINLVYRELVKGKSDVVIGSRTKDMRNKNFSRYILNKIANVGTFLIYGILVEDSQSGLKGFNRKSLERIQIKSSGYEFCSELIGEIKRKKLTYTEVPVSAIYTKYSREKGQKTSNGLKIMGRLLLKS